MEIDCDRLRHSLLQLKSLSTEGGPLGKYVRLEKYSEKDIDTIVHYLARYLLDSQYTQEIAATFPDLLFVIVVHALPVKEDSVDSWDTYLRQCFALSTLVSYSPEIARYAVTYFSVKEPPFREKPSALSKKKVKHAKKSITDFEIVQCCYHLLVSNPSFYKEHWDWSIFVDQYSQTKNEIQQLYYNHALAILFNMTQSQLNQLDEKISNESILHFYNNVDRKNEILPALSESPSSTENKILWNFSSKVVTNIEGILLPIYNPENAEHYSKTSVNCDKIVRVDSTKANLKNVAMGLSSNKAICLLGPVGCGKTTLVEYLAEKTGRITPKRHEAKMEESGGGNETNGVGKSKSHKRKIEEGAYFAEMKTDDEPRNGFLRIQLGDQTDSKVLLGQYRCTDVPGEFIWLPGVLTQAVMNGYWLLLEDLDLAPQDTCTILSNLLENGNLSVPGFRDSLKISPGFQLFITVRSNKNLSSTQKTTFSLLEKYFYIVNIVSLSRNELCQVVSVNYPKLATIANRIVDVYLLFSSGGHVTPNNYRKSKFEDSSEYTVLPTTNTEIESFTEIVNSGRLVSTRDLMKLCERSHAMFSATSAEYAYFVFQNAADIFCSYLPHSVAKTKLITSIGARLGIIQSRCEYFSNDYKPDIEDDNCGIKVGRTYLEIKLTANGGSRKRQSGDKETPSSVAEKKSKLGEDGLSFSLTKKDKVTFSFTRLACCLLERIGVCVNQAEPILLVGETGVGKTSCVQYLAAKTNHKLVVVNMNNQSDVSDLVGGFKPVDLSYVVAPIRQDFEILFRKTFNENKNEKFLLNVSACFNRGDFTVLVKLMLKIADTVFKRAESDDLNIKTSKTVLKEWKELHVKLTKLISQLNKSINVSFAFITGSLVNCIKNGDWVLLDEINLASDETLECLSTILERDGSIVLLEKGDLMPVKRHPDFRIFACMNPRTDVGKKDLPTGIRNRFTEFFVDELSSEVDLRILIGDYLRNTGISSTKISAIVKLYGQLKALSQMELNDGLGNKPIFSLRTLCRSLTICARNLCGSIDRNLYESFCLSFLTQLDNDSHKVVLDLIKSSLLSNSKAILSQEIPRPGSDYINFEGYWIEQGSKQVIECPEYILTDTVRENLKDVARIISIGKLPILLQGPTSAGKTSLIQYIAKMSGNHCLRINNHEHTDLQEYIGTYIADNTGKLVFKEGILVQAMRNGYWIILDELNLASTDILEALNRVLDDNRELFIPETQVVVKAHPKFMLFATQNPPGLYGGRKTLSRAFKNRFIELHFSEIPRAELEIILERRCQIPKSYSQKMVKCMSELQVNRKTTSKNNFTLRDLFRWGNRYTWADKKLLANNLYDWNQHLVDEGYLVLSAKVRTETEIEIIEETLFKNFRKKVDLNNLYSLHEKTSLVTRDIVESLLSYTERSDIIWTQNMTRMAVLTAKALQFREPVLLVGPTGCGKTTICQILADIQKTNLRILNCHMHTEGADFLGGLRPCRDKPREQETEKQLFEWVDGPLIHAMRDGSFFMVDEISLAEDSVLERLNSVLETSRTIVLAEKGGALSAISKEFIIQAAEGFQFLATMNPGGDFGKKELSPALRNRFTEVWCQPSTTEEDLVRIASNILELGITTDLSAKIQQIARVMIKIVFFLKYRVDKFKFSVRDILAWAKYINVNSTNTSITFEDSILYGLDTIFLDSLEMLPYETEENIAKIRIDVKRFAADVLQEQMGLQINAAEMETRRGLQVAETNGIFGIKPFFIEINPNTRSKQVDFQFNAPTTQKNLLRLLSALSLNKAILLEGPPGVGKTSTVENLARAIGYHIVRINLCEHTDLADLFGTDLPAEEKTLDMAFTDKSETELKSLGSFVWRDGPLLSALKSKHTWILLDELNLAPQSVLEGLNAILDHRGEVFIPELNKTFTLGQQTRIFACQNPLRQGGGRKGLPQSFLNRFTKVYLSKLHTEDLLHVVNGKYASMEDEIKAYFRKFFSQVDLKGQALNLFDAVNSLPKLQVLDSPNGTEVVDFDLLRRMVSFSERLNDALSSLEFGIRGGPYEINLRDILRWCEFLFNPETGFIPPSNPFNVGDSISVFKEVFDDFLLVLYERMKLVYYQRMRSDADRAFIKRTFSEVFNCNGERLNALSEDVSLYWTDSELFLNDIVLSRNSHLDSDNPALALTRGAKPGAIILNCQLELLKNVVECVHMEKAVILSGPTNSGKTKVIDTLCCAANESYETEIIEDSVTGSFQQIDLNRHLEEVANSIEAVYLKAAHQIFVSAAKNKDSNQEFIRILKLWNKYSSLSALKCGDSQKGSVMSEEMLLFKNRIKHLRAFIRELKTLDTVTKSMDLLSHGDTVLSTLDKIVKITGTLNTGGHFEWVDSKIVKSLKTGAYICLEHVNFCSPAILDRLNPVFEPNGSLLLSEKGVTADDESEIVHKHPAFRAFLTIDPKHGELSRAMRNRCVELDFSRLAYTEDDLRQIVYLNGIHENYLINTMIRIYELCKSVTELDSFNVSHLIHCAYLVTCNKRTGLDDEQAVYNSSMEVYVFSTTVDLLGYGLEFYQNRLREIIVEECTGIKPELNVGSLENTILKPNEMNQVSLIKMQCEPLLCLLKCYPDEEATRSAIGSLFPQSKSIVIKSTFDAITHYMGVLYAISSMNELPLRYSYLNHIINSFNANGLSADETRQLQVLNKSLHDSVADSKSLFPPSHASLPWNSKLLPRIRSYSCLNSERTLELGLNAKLLAQILVEQLTNEELTKLNKMSALGYSQAVSSGKTADNFNNTFLQQLWPFMQHLHEQIGVLLRHANLTMTEYSSLLLALLWFNRFYKCSKNRFVVDKQLDVDLMDKMLLHFKWIKKKLLKCLRPMSNDNERLDKSLERVLCKIEKYLLDNSHPLNILQKKYAKEFTSFAPYYAKEQVDIHDCGSRLERLTALVPCFGSYDTEKTQNVLKCIDSMESEAAKNLLAQNTQDILSYIEKMENCELDESVSVSEGLKMKISEFLESIIDTPVNVADVDQSAISGLLDKLGEVANSATDEENESITSWDVSKQILPLKDLYGTKAFLMSKMSTKSLLLNDQYFNTISTSSCLSRQLFNVFNSDHYRKFKMMWQAIMSQISSSSNPDDLEPVLSYLSAYYRNFSTFDRVLQKLLQYHNISTISVRNDILTLIRKKQDIIAETRYTGPRLTNCLFLVLFQEDGGLKPIELSVLIPWKKVLNDVRQIVWNNSVLMSDEFNAEEEELRASLLYSKKLVLEVEYIERQCGEDGNDEFAEYNHHFQGLVNKLKTVQTLIQDSEIDQLHPHSAVQHKTFYTALLNSLIGAIELCVFTFLPLVDPVEKNRLKKLYGEEDVKVLTTLFSAYDLMRVVMRYKNLGNEEYQHFASCLLNIKSKLDKFSQKVALRPEVCRYNKLVVDIKHFLKMNCTPASLLKLINDIVELEMDCAELASNDVNNFLLKSTEMSKKLELWIVNSQRFLFDVKKNFSSYYNDFSEPLECAILTTQSGFGELRSILTQQQRSLVLQSNASYCNINENGKLCDILQGAFQFPFMPKDEQAYYSITKKLHDLRSVLMHTSEATCERMYLIILKATLLEVKNRISVSCLIEDHTFHELQTILAICGKIWRDEEERKRKQQIEDESLYVNKTLCETENEEEIELEEIQRHFPTNVEDDFGEFIVQDTLEQVKVPKKNENTKKVADLITAEEYQIIAQNFVYIMEYFARIYYYKGRSSDTSRDSLDYITPFKMKLPVFAKLILAHRLCLNSVLDHIMHNTYGFIVGLQQEMVQDLCISDDNAKSYNFYKDSNIPEIINCTELMERIVLRTNEQLALYPEHAVLLDIIRVIEKIKGFPSTSPVARFNTGFQILRQKLAQWNEVAHKRNHFRDLEEEAAVYVQKWTRLELQFWRNCLVQTFDRIQSDAYRYWFFLYNLLHEYLDREDDDDNKDSEVVGVIRQFVESSNYADFSIRMRLLRSFEIYLHYVNAKSDKRKSFIIATLRNTQIYFNQFANEIEDSIKTFRTPIEKKLREFVKIESYNKDLSYFSMKSNVARVHRNLNKFLKEYEVLLRNKISPVFQQKENASQDYNLENDKGINLRYEPRHKYYMLDAKNFLAPQKLKNIFKEMPVSGTGSSSLLVKCEKLFATSRTVVRDTIQNTQFSMMIHSLDSLLTDQIETCEYLRKLEVDRSQERPKQKTQAKHILSQKKKGLSDLYKTLANLGISYKTGLMELSLKSDFTDFSIQPFCVRTMLATSKGRKLDQNLIYLNDNLDLYFAKCVFKMKLLQNVMLTPNAEMGPMNIDRMKGFSIDMFLLVQNQRKLLSESIKDLFDLRKAIEDIEALIGCAKSDQDLENRFCFEKLEHEYAHLKLSLCEMLSIIEQYTLLFKCLPHCENVENTVLADACYRSLPARDLEKHSEIVSQLKKLASDIRKVLNEMVANCEVEFLSAAYLRNVRSQYDRILARIETLRNEINGPRNAYLPVVKPLNDLLNAIKETQFQSNLDDTSTMENVDNEIENAVHSVLISLQKVYKKYKPAEEVPGAPKDDKEKSIDKESEDERQPIQENHLKEKIHKNILSDIADLRLSEITEKLSNILLAVKYTGDANEKLKQVHMLASILPILQQFNLMGEFYLFQQLGAHKVSAKMLSIMLTVFIELGTKGFCVPPDLMQDEEEGQEKQESKQGEGFGLEDGTGENDVSDKIESEDQLDDAKRPEDRKDKDEKDNTDCKEEKGIDMSEDFDANMQDVDKKDDDDSDDDEKSDEEHDKQMGETEAGAEKLDDQIWGSDDEKEEDEEENEMSEEEEGGGNKEDEDKHNDTGAEKDNKAGEGKDEQADGLDATNENDDTNNDKKKQNEIDKMKDPQEPDEEQANPYHNELEEPPEAEELDMGDCNIDEDNGKDEEDKETENPFEIDKIKEGMDVDEGDDGDEENVDEEAKDQNKEDGEDDTDSEPEPEVGEGAKSEADKERDEENQEDEEGDQTEQSRDDQPAEEAEPTETEEKKEEKPNNDDEYSESKDQSSKEENVHSVQDKDTKGSNDQVVEQSNAEQDSNMDAQDTGEEKENVGQAENDATEGGHQGVADTKETAFDKTQNDRDTKDKKKGNVNEERTLGKDDKSQVQQLKTVDKLKENDPENSTTESEDKPPEKSDEYQHVREAKDTDKTTLDNATEDQSKQIQHLEDEDEKMEDETEEASNELMDAEEDAVEEENTKDISEMESEKMDQNSNKPSKKSEKTNEVCETTEQMEVEGELTETHFVPREDTTTAHCNKDLLRDSVPLQEPSTADELQLRKMYQDDLLSKKSVLPQTEDYAVWQSISNKMSTNARELCEQLRLILEPTKCTRLKGDYRTGRRINMRKIIPYIASQFRKDKIWLRRTKPSQRDYKITIAIDDSKSMHHNNSKRLTLEAISLVSQALTLLESGKLSIVSFGESPHVLLHHTEQFDGPRLVQGLEFAQNQSKIAELMDFVRTATSEEGMSSDNKIFENLLLVISDGRNIFSEGEQKVKNAIKLARLQRIFIVYVIIDNPENKHSILDIRMPQFSSDRKSITMRSYLDTFPFPYYVIVRDLGQLPLVLSEAMRQWFELVNSEQ